MATERCVKCTKLCYVNEKIKSTKGQVFHKACFRCSDCNISLQANKDHIGPDALVRCKPCFESIFGRNGSIIAKINLETHKPQEASARAEAENQATAANLEEDLAEIKDFMVKKKWLRAADLISILSSNTAPLKNKGYLVYAAMHGATLDVFEACVDFGSEVDELDGTVSALFCAVGRRNLEAAQFLLDRGANVNLLDKYGRSPLWVACKNNAPVELARLLLARGADVNQQDVDGRSPLAVSVASNQPVDFLQVLLSAPGIQVNARDRHGHTCLFDAYSVTDVAVLELLVGSGGADVNVVSTHGETVLHVFAANGASAAHFRAVLQAGGGPFTQIKAKDESGRTVLLVASSNCTLEVLELLLNHHGGTASEDTDPHGRNALFYAAQANQDLPVIKLLVERGKANPLDCGFSAGESMLECYRQRGGNAPVVDYLASLAVKAAGASPSSSSS